MNIAERMLKIKKKIVKLKQEFIELENALMGLEFTYKNDPCAMVVWINDGGWVTINYQNEDESKEEQITLEELSKFI